MAFSAKNDICPSLLFNNELKSDLLKHKQVTESIEMTFAVLLFEGSINANSPK